jgi:energy-converting hydrogenase Eha subunit F
MDDIKYFMDFLPLIGVLLVLWLICGTVAHRDSMDQRVRALEDFEIEHAIAFQDGGGVPLHLIYEEKERRRAITARLNQ